MSLTVYIVSIVSVFFFSGLMAMAGPGAAFIFVSLFFYWVCPLPMPCRRCFAQRREPDVCSRELLPLRADRSADSHYGGPP